MAHYLYGGAAGAALVGLLEWWRWRRAEVTQRATGEELRLARAELERDRAELRLRALEEIEALRRQVDDEWRERRAEQQATERRLAQKEEALDRRQAELTERGRQLDDRETRAAAQLAAAEATASEARARLERLAGLTSEQARAELLRQVEAEAREEAARLARRIEESARRDAEQRARDIVAVAIERCAVEQVTDSAVSVVPLSGDDVKGRIIGREGRNIRSFEQLTGVDLVIDDTPEAVLISAFDPIRREVARLALSELVADGRIHPGRIEEVVDKCRRQLDEELAEAGRQAAAECGVTGLAPAVLEALGRLKYRTSYGQNVLRHSLEVARLAGTLAAELGAKVEVARLAGLLHDVGKALNGEQEGPHAVLGQRFLERHGLPEAVTHAVGAHHRDEEPATVEAMLVLTADALSAARAGARRDSLESYLQRLERLEAIAREFPGVEKVYAVQAGREVRVVVRPEELDDAAAAELARTVAQRIESELAYPGHIKVVVIREQRSIEYAN